MKIFYMLLLLFVVIAFAWIMYRLLYVNTRSRKLAQHKLQIFEKLLQMLIAGQAVTTQYVLRLAEDPSTRSTLYKILERFDRTTVFPPEYFTLEKSAESFIVSWLEFPTELNTAPDEIELVDKIDLAEGQGLLYYVFRFKKHSLNEEWMIGVVGPFGIDSKPYEFPQRIFSRFNVMGTVSLEEEVRWVHRNISPTN